MSHIQYVDELIREYLLFRGFSVTLKSFDVELKQDKEKGFRVDKVVDQLMQSVYAYDLISLRELWNHLDQKMFSKLEHDFMPAVRKLENAVLKLYIVNAVTNNKPEKINEFFTKLTPDLQGQTEWKDWFMLPYMKNPEDSPLFSVHFTRQWQDTLLVSLHNLLAVIYQAMPQPVLSSFEEESSRIRRLTDENELLKQKLVVLQGRIGPEAPPPPDLMDDFYTIAQENPSVREGHAKSLKSFIRTIGGGLSTPSSPMMSRKLQQSCGAVEHQRSKSKQRVSSTANTAQSWTKQVASNESGSKRSLSVDAWSRSGGRGARDASLDNLDRREPATRTDQFLLLSQEEMIDHQTSVTQCRFNAAGSLVASADMDGVVKLWSPAPLPKLLSSMALKSSVLCLDWVSKNERYFVTGSASGMLSLHDSKENKLVWEVGAEEKSLRDSKIVSVCCSPTETSFVCAAVSANGTGKLLLYDIKTKKVERSFSLSGSSNIIPVANCCVYNHNGQLLIAGCSDGSIRTIDLRHSECIDSTHAHKEAVQALKLSPDHNYCYSIAQDNKLCRMSLAQTAPTVWEALLPDSSLGQAFTLDQVGNHALICCGHNANIYQIGNGLDLVLQLGGHRSPTVTCDWATANQCATCVTASSDGKVRVSTFLTP